MPASRLGLYELLAPQFLLGFTFPEHVDRYLSVLGVDEVRTSWDESAAVHVGRVSFTGEAGALPVREHRDPSGAVFEWEDVDLEFRLTLPRDGAAPIKSTLTSTVPPSSVITAMQPVDALFDRFGPVEQALGTLLSDPPVSTEYPGIRFRLEILVSALTFHLGKSWWPGEVGADHRIKRMDPALVTTPKDVRFVLPKVVLEYEQTDDLTTAPTFRVKSWGSSGFEAPSDLEIGEAVRMEPPIALHESGRFAFGIGHVLVDLSQDHTPPELLAFFGVDEAFEGIYVKSLQLYYADSNKSLGFNFGIRDALISFAGEVSLEARLDILGPLSTLRFEVKLYEGDHLVPYTRGQTRGGASPNSVQDGRGRILNTGVVHVTILGGIPPYTVSVKLDTEEIWDATTRTAPISPSAPTTLRTPGTKTMAVDVRDAGTGTAQQSFLEEIELTIVGATAPTTTPLGLPADRLPAAGALPVAVFAQTTTGPSGYGLSHSPAAGRTAETITVLGPPGASATVAGVSHPIVGGRLTVEVPEGSSTAPIPIVVTWPAVGSDTSETFHLLFELDRPNPVFEPFAQIRDQYKVDQEVPHDEPFSTSQAPNGGTALGVAALQQWVTTRVLAGTPIQIAGHASFEFVENEARDQRLSERRAEIAKAIVAAATGANVTTASFGHSAARNAMPQRVKNRADRVALITGKVALAAPAVTLNGTIGRAARPAPTPTPTTPVVTPSPAPEPAPNEPPSTFRRISFRIRLERNVPVLLEVSGELDFETEMESKLRTVTPASGSAPSGATGNLGLTQTAAASSNPNPADGIVDFTVAVTYDTATHALAEMLALGASPDDINGLLQMTNPRTGGTTSASNRLKDTLGAVLVLAPVTNAAAAALDTDSAGDWAILAVSVAVPAAIGATGMLQTTSVTLYGGELRFRQFIPPSEAASFTDAGVLFDYGVKFKIEIPSLGVTTEKEFGVRYRAVGFNLHFDGGVTYQPIFDTSRGYEINLADGGALTLPSPLGDILKILAARIARTNPLTLEVDLGMKVDLGVVTVDRFRVKWPIDPLRVPSILPTGAKIDIPGAIIGSGFVNIIEPPGPGAPADAISAAGFEGMLDVSLVSLKLRICASLGVRHLIDPPKNREAIAIFAGLIVDFPAPIPILQSGIGFYGMSGLFAMHYKRLEDPPVPGDSVGPALRWLVKAKGEPAKLAAGVPPVTVWGPEFDRWSFGLGARLGTMEGGFLANFRGMLVVELPGPRILIFVKIEIVAALKSLEPATDLTVGILGVVDLDFNLWQLTVGIIVDLEIKDIVQVKLPVELFFKLKDPAYWHLHIGTFQSKAEAKVLNLVCAYGYFQISGHDIVGWPGYGTTRTLPGIAVATGIAASITLGDESIGLYLKVGAKADLGVSFFPGKMFMVGRVQLDGELRLFIVSIEAHGHLDVEAPDPTYLDGEICGKVDFFFFSVKGCVGLSIGSNLRSLPAPPLVDNVFLQSHAPVLTAGQADRAIDSSLGDAVAFTGATFPTGAPVVPIDTVPVIQFRGSPLVAGATTFTQPLVASPRQTVGGWIPIGGDRKVSYQLKEISLQPPLPTTGGLPPATWRMETTPGVQAGAKTNIDLALMSRVPATGERALERSSELLESVTLRWENLCDPVAPAVCVLWTFCGEPIGPSGEGWHLDGIPQPDSPGNTRTTVPPTDLYVEEPEETAADTLVGRASGPAGAGARQAAKVIGPGSGRPGDPGDPTHGDPGDPSDPPVDLLCVRYGRFEPGDYPNPRDDAGMLVDGRDFAGARLPASRIVTWDVFRGLDVGFRTIVGLPAGSRAVEVTLVHFSQPARVTAYNADGTASAAAMSGPQRVAETLRLTGPSIIRVVIDAPADEAILLSLCAERQPRDRRPPELHEPIATGDARRDRLALELATVLFERDRRDFEETERVANEIRRLPGTLPLGVTSAVPSPLLETPPGALQGIAPFPGRLPSRVVAVPGPVTAALTAPSPAMPTQPVTSTGGLAATCFRALQLPAVVRRRAVTGFKPNRKATAYLKSRPNASWIILHTGAATRVRILLAVASPTPSPVGVVIRQLDGSGNVVHEDRLDVLAPGQVTGVTGGLPAEWLDAAGPWRSSVLPVATFLADAEFAALERWVLTLKPDAKTDRIQIFVPTTGRTRAVPEVLVGVVDVCPAAEEERVETEELVRDGQIKTLTGYLDGDTLVPLLEKGKQYKLRVRYDVTTHPAVGPDTVEADKVQEFAFKTDDKEPKRLDPWVLGTTPNDMERFVFWRDKLKVVFNDLAVIQLFKAYGKDLRVVVRAADGVPIPHEEITSLDPVDADFASPYRDAMEALVGAGLLPCTGTTTFPHHGSWTSGVELRPLMAYTLDIQVEPPNPAPTGAAANNPVVPLYRRSFSTSRFPDLAALADDLKGRSIRHRVLSSQLTGLPTGAVSTATDQAIQAALVAAGEQALPAPEENGLVVYWAKRSGASTFSPHAILVDAAEPLWRTRQEPKLEVVPNQSDPAYKRIVPSEVPAFELIEQGTSGIARFVHSPSGTRTLAIVSDTFSPGSTTGSGITLAVRRPASTLYGIAAATLTLAAMTFGAVAPWEEDA